jgi:rRNA maturation RNase YbeY
MSGQIDLHSELPDFILSNEPEVLNWIRDCVSEEEKTLGQLNFIFCSDAYLLDLNQRYLDHDYYTDVITFDYSNEAVVSGDVFISIERVKDNARELQIDNETELNRVMIHGVLHLCGHGDKSASEQKVMREKEDYYLSLRSF